ncbi:MAG: TrmH family RNA methyltransferase [Bacteroidetes bacterium]|nr:TrmH family RNA methyltransferase [Bacteroidota bacterium]PHX82653.1 MAG: rRNA methyltransferase [Flavobacteriales bacterium]
MDNYSKELYEYLSKFATEQRMEKFESVIQERTRYLTIVVENVYQPHNASAVLRSAECFGVQDVHIIENSNKYNPSADISLGAHQWLSLTRHGKTENNSLSCIQALKKNGYRIVATTPHKNDCLISEIDLSKGKIALFFGTEIDGLSDTILNEADEFVKIPMYGFTESFNISVSAAISMYELMKRLRESKIEWRLTAAELLALKLDWVKESVKSSDLLEKEFRKQRIAE